jgi:hypothetical protein
MKIETGKKYVQRNGEVVTCLTDKAWGEYPVLVQHMGGAVGFRREDGTSAISERGDLVSEYVEPRKAVEAWAFVRSDAPANVFLRDTQEGAERVAAEFFGGTIHHLREVNPAREAAVEELARGARGFLNCEPTPLRESVRNMRAGLDALDAAEGVK